MKKSYRDLEVYKESFQLFIEVHFFSKKLPNHEMHELGSQLRRSADSIVTNIVEGYGRRNFKKEFERFLAFSHASTIEIICHLEKIEIIYPMHKEKVSVLLKRYDMLARKIFRFIKYVEGNWLLAKLKPQNP